MKIRMLTSMAGAEFYEVGEVVDFTADTAAGARLVATAQAVEVDAGTTAAHVYQPYVPPE